MEELQLKTAYNEFMDQIEADILRLPPVQIDIRHIIAPGIITREMRAPAGAFITSKTHKTEHIFMLLQGSILVRTEADGVVRIDAPFTGKTFPGTRRVAYVIEDVIWSTIHATNLTDPEELEKEIIVDYKNPLINVHKMEELR